MWSFKCLLTFTFTVKFCFDGDQLTDAILFELLEAGNITRDVRFTIRGLFIMLLNCHYTLIDKI